MAVLRLEKNLRCVTPKRVALQLAPYAVDAIVCRVGLQALGLLQHRRVLRRSMIRTSNLDQENASTGDHQLRKGPV